MKCVPCALVALVLSFVLLPALAQNMGVAAEDGRFYQHHGFDWRERAARSLHKGVEFTLLPVAELAIGKRRILELYLTVVEWGPGIYGAESACRSYYRTSARNIAGNSQHSSPRFCRLPEATA